MTVVFYIMSFREHLGLLEEQCHHHGKSNTDSISVEDPLCEKFYGTWMRTAEDNMKIYEEVNIHTHTLTHGSVQYYA